MSEASAPAPQILDAHGQPARRAAAAAKVCPRCGGTKRVASAGFGVPHPICPRCGHEWHGEAFEPDEETR